MRPNLISTISFITFLSICSCAEEPLEMESSGTGVNADTSSYWHTHTRSAEENRTMLRHHAVGFSYQGISGKKCNVADVMCQVLNLDYLRKTGCYEEDNTPSMIDNVEIKRGICDYNEYTSWSARGSVNLTLYQGERHNGSDLHELITDTTLNFHQTIGLRTCEKTIDLASLLGSERSPGMISDPDKAPMILSDNFKYALDRIRRSGNNEAVIDSFVNIFGTHVVTGASCGGSFDLSVNTSKRSVRSYLEEEEFKKNCAKFFVKAEKIERSEHYAVFRNIFKTARVSLKVKGGDATVFDALIANPYYDNVNASLDCYNGWLNSIGSGSSDMWDTSSELIDMEMTPIWMFIPDKETADRVMTRIVASSKKMQELYGNQNFVNAELYVPDMETFIKLEDNYAYFDYLKQESTNAICHAVTDGAGHPSRIVAATYYEYIPEFDRMIYVTYPVYENRIQIDRGIGYLPSTNSWYKVQWLYDRYILEKFRNTFTDKIYVYKGNLYLSRPNDENAIWSTTCKFPDYEIPGSIRTNGDCSYNNLDIKTVTKFLNYFYLATQGVSGDKPHQQKYDNMPGWTYITNDADLISSYYQNNVLSDKDLDYIYSTTGLQGYGFNGRMVRNPNYRYRIIPKELGF